MVICTSFILISEPPPKELPKNDLTMQDALVQQWSKIRFDAIDTLHISPFNAWLVNGKYMFGIGNKCTETNPLGDYADRFEWVVKHARTMNPKIKIIAMQMHNDGDYSVLKNNYHDYTTSVAQFLTTYHQKTLDPLTVGKDRISARIDGYDLDYEWAGPFNEGLGSGNQQTYSADILEEIRSKINKVDPLFEMSISAATTTGIEKTPTRDVAKSLNYIKMQNYSDPNVKHFTDALGVGVDKLVYGIEIESPWKNTTTDGTRLSLPGLVSIVQNGKYAGIMTWRQNVPDENPFQVWLYNQFNTTKIKDEMDDNHVFALWKKNGGAV